MPDLASMLIGGAQQAAENQGAGIAQGVQAGIQNYGNIAQLAINKQKLDMQQQELQNQMQQLTMEKYSRVGDWWEKAAAMPAGPVRNAFVENWIPKGTEAMGLQNSIDPTVMKMFQKEPQVAAQLHAGVLSGKYDPSILLQPDKVAAVYPELVTGASAQEISQTATDQNAQLMKEYQDSLERKSREKESEARIAESRETAMARIQASGNKAAAVQSDKLATEIRNKFEPLSKDQTALASAQDARDRVMAQLKADPSGKSVSPQDMGAMIFSLLHSELGRVNSVELANQLHIPGIENMAEDQLVKLMGGVNPNVVPGLVQRVNTAAQELDKRKDRLAKAYAPQIAGRPDAAATLNAYQERAFKPSQNSNPFGNANAAQLRTYIQQFPNNADIPQAVQALKALGG